MPQLVILVVDQDEHAPAVIEAWQKAGVNGITIHQTTGLGRGVKHRDDLPLMPSLRALFESRELEHRTLWAVLPDHFNIERLFDITEEITGPLDAPHTGIMFTIPITRVRGLRAPGT
jgi:nitrogen regulatory protein P-II 1